MQDGIIKGTGNSRYLKSISNFLQQYPTYQDFVAALVAGTLPIDLNGINETGWDQLGTALNKANLLSDETVEAFGDLLQPTTPGNPVVDDALRAAAAVVYAGNCKIEYGSYTGTGNYSSAHPNSLTFSGNPLFVVVQASGGSGGVNSIMVRGASQSLILSAYTNLDRSPNSVSWETANQVSWWSSQSAEYQLNQAPVPYYYIGLISNSD